ncbi:hypothetical protein BDV34DRAFT_24252 [Aspergillus parasiticus]|uniref:Uncharacterized protein n=1 Tax=Aspergillus parasiticus TaxID=5067 RepID=A0A5N6DWV4_ASPPA|nr:hypothetical protein BDV34DRAFT_24252 [Aspergillus parasiticus]
MYRICYRTRLLALSAGFLPVPIRKLSHCPFCVYNVESVQGAFPPYALVVISNGDMVAWCIFAALTWWWLFLMTATDLCSGVASQQCRWTVVVSRRWLWWRGQRGKWEEQQ